MLVPQENEQSSGNQQQIGDDDVYARTFDVIIHAIPDVISKLYLHYDITMVGNEHSWAE